MLRKILVVLFAALALAACHPATPVTVEVTTVQQQQVVVEASAPTDVPAPTATQAPTETATPTAIPPTSTPQPTATQAPAGRICPEGDPRLIWGAPNDGGILAPGQRQQIGLGVQKYLDGEITIDELIFPIQQDALATCVWTMEAHDIPITDEGSAHIVWCAAEWASVPEDAGDPVFTTPDGGSLYLLPPGVTGTFEGCGPDGYKAWATKVR